jgi:hypothetical protein
MKRKLFIGSSSESLNIAKLVKEEIEKKCSDWLECVIWNEKGIFTLNKATLDCLIRASRRYDYGILVATGDDISFIRRSIFKTTRDNVLLELGLFLGSLGLSRAFLFVDKKCKIPSDYLGINAPSFQRNNVKSIVNKANEIIEELEKTRNSYSLKPIPSSALALGYFENFVKFLATEMVERGLDFNLKILLPTKKIDVETEKRVFKTKNPSEDFSILGNNTRPTVNKIVGEDYFFWDIPTTLKTLDTLIEKVVHISEIGDNLEKSDWIDYELRNFRGTIEVLVEQCKACKGKVTVEWLD